MLENGNFGREFILLNLDGGKYLKGEALFCYMPHPHVVLL